MSFIARYIAHFEAKMSGILHYYFGYRLYCFFRLHALICEKVENT
jgi:hypothetical protein